MVFHTAASRKATVEDEEDVEDATERAMTSGGSFGDAVLEEVKEEKTFMAFLPPSLVKGRANVSTEDRPTAVRRTAPPPPKAAAAAPAPAIDFFGLGTFSSRWCSYCA